MSKRRAFGSSKHRKARIEKFKAKHPGSQRTLDRQRTPKCELCSGGGNTKEMVKVWTHHACWTNPRFRQKRAALVLERNPQMEGAVPFIGGVQASTDAEPTVAVPPVAGMVLPESPYREE